MNDDGVFAEGILALREALRGLGDVWICAPLTEQSATGHAITINKPLRLQKIEDQVFAVEGYPADCVKVAVASVLPRKPDFVVSGINRGPNLGFDTLYSGTVGAALEGALLDIPSVAVSAFGKRNENLCYETAGHVTVKVFQQLIDNLPRGCIYNINTPSYSIENLEGIKVTSVGRRLNDNRVEKLLDPRKKPYYWLAGGEGQVEDIDGTDCVEIQKGFATISILRPSVFCEQSTSILTQQVGDFLPL